jgi:predicted RNA-binding Zn-ribbon protein involved in translation (DUF1610 family)
MVFDDGTRDGADDRDSGGEDDTTTPTAEPPRHRRRLHLSLDHWLAQVVKIEKPPDPHDDTSTLARMCEIWLARFAHASARASNIMRQGHYLVAQFLLRKSRRRKGEEKRGCNYPWLLLPRTGFGDVVRNDRRGPTRLSKTSKRVFARMGPGLLVDRVRHVAVRLGAKVSLPLEYGTTSKCTSCGTHAAMSLQEREFLCWGCRFQVGRDVKAADAILCRKFAVLVLSQQKQGAKKAYPGRGVKRSDKFVDSDYSEEEEDLASSSSSGSDDGGGASSDDGLSL